MNFRVAILLSCFAIASVAQASLTVALTLGELTTRSSDVVVGTVVHVESLWDERNRIVTDAVVQVGDTMKGSAGTGDEIVVRCLGGEIDDLGMRVEGEPMLERGERAMLFLRRVSGEDYLRPVGMSQGVMPIQRSEERGDLVIPGGNGVELVDRVSTGALEPAPGALMQATPIGDVMREVRRHARETP